MSNVVNRIQAGDGDPRHGSLGGYTNHGCRCDLCTEANRKHHVEDYRPRIRTPGLPEGDSRHGTYSGYTNYGCRCVDCRAAHHAYAHDYYLRTRGTS